MLVVAVSSVDAYPFLAFSDLTCHLEDTRIGYRIQESAIPPLFNGLEVLSSAYGKAKLFAENLSKNSNLDD